MRLGKWRVLRGHLRTGMAVWIAAPPLSSPLGMHSTLADLCTFNLRLRTFDTHAEALAYAIEQAEAER